jgi:hypothetical protein
MGYTHYWYRKEVLDRNEFSNAIKDISLVFSYTKPLEYPKGLNDSKHIIDVYELNSESINFNGIGEQAHETFSIKQNIIDEWYGDDLWKFNFCKTARKPYDKYVIACLYIFKHHFADDIKISSDGDETEWYDGIKLVKDVLGYPYDPNKFELDETHNLNEELKQ